MRLNPKPGFEKGGNKMVPPKYVHVNTDNIPIRMRKFCIKCYVLCEHDEEIRKSTTEELQAYSNEGPFHNPSPPSLYVVHKKCDN